MKNTPNVSFSQETPEMEFKKIKDLFDCIPAMKSKVVENKDGRSLLINRQIVQKKQVIDSTDELIKFDAKDDSGHVKGGDILFTTSGNKKDVGRASVIDLDNDNLYYGNFLFAFRPKGEYSAGYLATVLNLPRTRQQIVKNGRASTSFVNIKKDDLMKVKIQVYKDTANFYFMFNTLKNIKYVPQSHERHWISKFSSFEIYKPSQEQNKIGSFFQQLDNTIALHQRKLDLLKEQKKGYLQKMFPKNGAKVPELRFAGFADDWEERKLSDIADRFDNLRVPITASNRKPGDTPYYGANGIQDYVEGFTHNGEFILVAEDGANDLKNYPVQYVNGKAWVNNHAHVLQGKKTITDNKFLMNAIKNFNIEPFLVGGGRAKLNADVMMKLNILLPTFVEQEKIGSFFQQLDETIALHQRKLDLLKEQKKGFLQKMFV